MNKSRIVSAVMVMVLMLTALAAVPIQSTAQLNSYDDLFPARGAAADSARWVAMGEFYTRLLETKWERAAQADVARWVAVGEFYASLDSQDGSDPARGAAADSARWVAMGEFYASLDSQDGSDLASGAAADTARWVAMGEFYTRSLETKRERAAQADAARWVAKGEFYASLILQSDVGCPGGGC